MLNDEGQPHLPKNDDAATDESRIELPPIPADQQDAAVAAWSEPVVIDTYHPVEAPDHPAFLENRVYQGSSGRVFPLPFHDRIAHEKRPHAWQAVHLENEWVRLVILPELGGRIHIGYDKSADYDFFYRNNVIKPALVGLAGPWISGGVEFNWPQHHRPATYLPTDFEIEREADGSVTVWCSDHDPFARMKGMHGIRLRPGSAVVEARVRLFNRTEVPQTFLWWANVAAAVNDDYQSFFPTDVRYVADHAKRAATTFPQSDGLYYGVDYPARVDEQHPDGDRLDWYRNIPVPTSYMIVDTDDDFFGGYDHGREAGFVYWADRHFAPGKKQWTWGNEKFGWAWDANLTDGDGPYVELMAGAYTDNQPDFTWIAPGETKTFSQFWYPIQRIGAAQQANLDAAVRLGAGSAAGLVEVAVAATRRIDARIEVRRIADDALLATASSAIDPGAPFVAALELGEPAELHELALVVLEGEDEVIRWQLREHGAEGELQLATEPPQPEDIESVDELFLTGQYLEQYRHATRLPEPYWEEALRRDPGDVRSHVALGSRAYAAARFESAREHFEAAIARLTRRVSNPQDGEAHYRLGLTLVALGDDEAAVGALKKSQWADAWRAAAGFELARIATRRGDLVEAGALLRAVLKRDADNLRARDLLALVLHESGDVAASQALLAETLELDALDQWARELAGRELTVDAPTLLDIALEYAEAGFAERALALLEQAVAVSQRTALGQVQVAPLVRYHQALILDRLGRAAEAATAREAAGREDLKHALPSRLADVRALEAALAADASDARAGYLLGAWYYDKQRADEAVVLWRAAAQATQDDELLAKVHRTLSIAGFNHLHDEFGALSDFRKAIAAAPRDAKLLYEYDQLQSRTGASEAERLAGFDADVELVLGRDDATIAYVRLLTGNGRAEEALRILLGRTFQPWEGGEGEALDAWERTHVALAAASERPEDAVRHLEAALEPPATLGEARHYLANAADLHFLLGEALRRAGREQEALGYLERAAAQRGDFIDMDSRPYSELSLFAVRALRALGRHEEADTLLAEVARYADELSVEPAKIPYFATSLPTMLLFHDDPQAARDREVAALRAGAEALSEQREAAAL